MHARTLRHAAAGLVALAALAAPAGASAAGTHARNAVFVQTNDPAGNAVVAFHRSADGSLRRDATYPTGGLGATAAGSPGDTLATQNGLVYDRGDGLLFAVNAGSDTLTVFRADGDTLTQTQVLPTDGPFPASVAVHGNLVYVLDAGGAGYVHGYTIHGDRLVDLNGSTRSLGLSNTTPPNFLTSPGQIGFSPGGRQLIVTTKANGTIDTFAVRDGGRLAQTPVVTTSEAPIPFAFLFDPFGHMVVAEAGPDSSASTYDVQRNGTLAPLDLMVHDGHPAACWIVQARGYIYVSNTGDSTISVYTTAANGALTLVNPVAASTGGGSIDLATSHDGRYLYVQNGHAGNVQEYAVGDDGSLTLVDTAGGLPVFDGTSGMEGLAAV